MSGDEPSSPVCYARDADAAYMGYASAEELIAFLNALLEAERAGARVTLESARDAGDSPYTDLLRAIHRDEARWCAMLIEQIGHLGGTPSEKTGAFFEKSMAIPALAERMAFLNRGQGWVARKLREMLPKVRDETLHAALKAMLLNHEENIADTNAALKAPSPVRDTYKI